MSINPNAAPATERGHLVSTGTDDENNHMLYIHIDKPCIGKHECNAFVPVLATGKVEVIYKTNSAKETTEELGWFSDINLFTQVCKNEPLPRQGYHPFKAWLFAVVGKFTRVTQKEPSPQQKIQDQNDLLKTWVSAVLDTLQEQHSALWVRNEGNMV
ncbi:hypothetical protein BDU57DRAFT_181460 [Ampelomyces quisqualis]|uniref:Uncharacterized protein n=1 Tax=Ampelomyces quisqualis TaxID=50730 RepID=A0A6A5QVP0_AMPQU|nr:hypothetical protein BDU57DRAFT_181460 [Ampelomyces quisqualis]